jgi:hypothetical protein
MINPLPTVGGQPLRFFRTPLTGGRPAGSQTRVSREENLMRSDEKEPYPLPLTRQWVEPP